MTLTDHAVPLLITGRKPTYSFSQKIVVDLSENIRIIAEIDKIVEAMAAGPRRSRLAGMESDHRT